MAWLRQPVRIRWWIFAFLFGFAVMSYLQRTSIAVAAKEIMSQLHLSHWQIGLLNAAFVAAYTLSQVPAAAFGQRYGARTTFVLVGIVGMLAMIATPLAPMLFAGTGLFLALLAAQALLGASQGPVFPVYAAVVEAWFPQKRWALANGLNSGGMNLGGLMTAPLIVILAQSYGWQGALLRLAPPAVVLTAWWGWYGRNTPEQHTSVTPQEIAELADTDRPPPTPLTWRRLIGIATNRDVLLLAISYLCMNFSFYLLSTWSYLYLVEIRKLSGIESGFAGALPWLGAAVGAAVGGEVCDRLVLKFGARWGYRLVPLVTLPIAGLMLLVTIRAATAYAAVAALTVAFCAVEFNEGAYWAATMRVARADTGAATGVLNTGGNTGGIVCGLVVGALADAGSYSACFVTGTVFALVGAGLWLLIDADRRLQLRA